MEVPQIMIYIINFNISRKLSDIVYLFNSYRGTNVNQNNPRFFDNVIQPDVEILEEEFERSVRKESEKTLDQLKKNIKKAVCKPKVSTISTKIYYRSPTIAAYVKKRANGYCQLCGTKAPFIDQNGDPYLECHHIEWLSKGGMNSADNCVALCPNCHRKMHIINDINDVVILNNKVTLV